MNISEQVKELRIYANEYERSPYGRAVEKTENILRNAAETIEFLFAKLQALRIENGGGWISCEDRLPDKRKNCLVTVRYTGFMGMYGFWIKTGHVEPDGQWWGDCIGGEVIAWQPLPEPYRCRSEDTKI